MPHMPEDAREVYPWHALRDFGVLWAVNATLLHPRGFAIASELPDMGSPAGPYDDAGWKLLGDGSEPWSFADDPDTHEKFRLFEAFLAGHRG